MSPSRQPVSGSLVERKQQLRRRHIGEAADELFLAEGFDKVSVSDIAVRADVGRTAYFHYFGTSLRSSSPSDRRCSTRSPSAQQEPVGIARTAGAAVKQPRPIVLDLRGRTTADHHALAIGAGADL